MFSSSGYCIHGNQYAAACPWCLSEQERRKEQERLKDEQSSRENKWENNQRNVGVFFQPDNKPLLPPTKEETKNNTTPSNSSSGKRD